MMLAQMLVNVLNWFSWFVAIAAVVMGAYSGFLFITARDDATQLAAARKTLVWTIAGIGVAIAAFGIIAIIKSILGF